MSVSSINFQKAKEHSSRHNLRKDNPSYLLPKKFQLKNEFWQNEKSEKELFNFELSNAKRKGGRIPKLENSRWEAVLNLNKNHTLEDVQKVAKHIEKKFNIISSEISIHRDEGHLEKGKPYYNLHAHLNFVTYKNGKQNWRKEHIKPQNLSELQTEVAELLGMDRGKINSKAQRLEHFQFRDVKKKERLIKNSEVKRAKKYFVPKLKSLRTENSELNEKLSKKSIKSQTAVLMGTLQNMLKEKKIAKELFWEIGKERGTISSQKELDIFTKKITDIIHKKNDEIKELKQELINSHIATKEEYQELREQYKKLEQQARDKDLTIEELKSKLGNSITTSNEMMNENKELKKEVGKLKEPEIDMMAMEMNQDLSNKLSEALQVIKTLQATISTQKSDLERLRVENERFRVENEQLKLELRTYRGSDRQEKRRELATKEKELKSKELEFFSPKQQNKKLERLKEQMSLEELNELLQQVDKIEKFEKFESLDELDEFESLDELDESDISFDDAVSILDDYIEEIKILKTEEKEEKNNDDFDEENRLFFKP